MILFTVIVALTFSRYAGAQDEMSEIQITPDFDLMKKTGESVTLACRFTTDDINNVKWIGPDKAQILKGTNQKRNVEFVEDGIVVLELRDLSVDDDGAYQCQGFSATANKTVIASKDVSVYDPVKFISTPEEQAFQIGQSATVLCSTTGTHEPKIYWRWNGSNIETTSSEKYFQDEGSSNLGIRNISKDDEGVYVCKARVLFRGEVFEKEIKVVVLVPPKIVNFDTELTVTEGREDVFSCQAIGNPEPTYNWYLGDGTGVTEVFSFGNALKLDIHRNMYEKYTCVANSSAGSDRATLTLTVNVLPSFTIMKNVSVQENEQAMLRCVAEGIPTPTVLMYRDNIMLPETVDDAESSNDGPLALGLKASNTIVNYSLNEATILFSNTELSDAGSYECRATNDAGYKAVNVTLDVMYAPRPRELADAWACDGASAQLNCEFDGRPTPELSWGRYLPSEGSNDNGTSTFVAFNSSNPPNGISIATTGGILSLTIDTNVVEDSWGTYVCSANNSAGSSNTTAQLKKAIRPRSPTNVQVAGVKTREANVSFKPFKPPLVPYTIFTITLTPNSSDVKTSTTVFLDPSTTAYTLRDLEHDTEYEVTVEANNCAGQSYASDTSQRKRFRTEAIGNPEPVEIISGETSEDHDQYTVRWRTQDVGGGEIKNITITVYKVVEDIDGENMTKIETHVLPPSRLEMENGSFSIENLNAATKYEISVDIYNDVGSAPATKRFLTNMILTETEQERTTDSLLKEIVALQQKLRLAELRKKGRMNERAVQVTQTKVNARAGNLTDWTEIIGFRNEPPTTTTATSDDSGIMMGSVHTKLIIIIIAVLLILIIIVDITCCYTRSWGLSYWIFAHTCRKSKKHNIQAAEEGSAEYRHEQQGNYKQAGGGAGSVAVEEEKQPLAEDVEHIANGEPGKLAPIDEQASLEIPAASSAPAVPNENGTVEGVKEQEEENEEKREEIVKEES